MTNEEIRDAAMELYPIPEDNNPTIHQQHCSARQGYLVGATRAIKEYESLPKIKGWVARDECGLLFYRKKPYRYDGIFYSHWTDEYGPNSEIPLDDNLFPELTWEDEPIEVELIIRKV